MVDLGSSFPFLAQSMEGLGLPASLAADSDITTTGEGLSWDTASAHGVTDGSWRHHGLKNTSSQSLLLSLFPRSHGLYKEQYSQGNSQQSQV